MRVAIVGSRSVRESGLVARAVEESGFPVRHLVTGGARGVDSSAERWARRHGIPVTIHRAKWRRYGSAAGPIRNQQVVDDAEAVIAVWDGTSTGTADTVERARKRGIPVFVLRPGCGDQRETP